MKFLVKNAEVVLHLLISLKAVLSQRPSTYRICNFVRKGVEPMDHLKHSISLRQEHSMTLDHFNNYDFYIPHFHSRKTSSTIPN
jgi:hypothetical protein